MPDTCFQSGWRTLNEDHDLPSLDAGLSPGEPAENGKFSGIPRGWVPEAGYWVCGRRYGIVPATLAPLLEKRRKYKKLKTEKSQSARSEKTRTARGQETSHNSHKTRGKEKGEPVASRNLPGEKSADSRLREIAADQAALYDARQKAIKWILVTCFGYLGYRNARFGRIEAHEAVTALGREKLLQAKEIAEARGWRVLHGLTDCLYLQYRASDIAETEKERTHECGQQIRESPSVLNPPSCPVPHRPVINGPTGIPDTTHLTELCDAITQATGVEMAIEGVYRWICFLPSRLRPGVSVPNRFWGVFRDGKVKVRGLMLRKHDTPEVLREAQVKALEALAQWETLEEAQAHRADVEAIFEHYAEQIRGGRLPREALAFKRRLTRSLENYRARTPVSISLWKLRNAGIRLEAGQFLRYIIVDARAPTPEERYLPLELCADETPYDVNKYLELLEEARAEILFYAVTAPKPAPPPSRACDAQPLPWHTTRGHPS